MHAVNLGVREQEEIAAGRKKPEKKPSYEVFLRNKLLTQGDQSNRGVD